MVHRSRCISVCVLLLCGMFVPGRAAAQAWFTTGTGLGVDKPRVAVADFAPRADNAKSHSQLFTQVVRDDLQFSGIVDLVSPSFYPVQAPTAPSELDNLDWTTPQINANLVAFGNLTESTSEVVISGWLYDVRSPSTQAVVGKVYRGTPTDAQVRKFAHQFADEIISRLSGGLPGIASTQIAFVSSRTGTKEIWVMDYDGANQHPLTSLHTISLTPRWSPDASRIAFTCFASGASGVVSPQICMYSGDANKVVSFPRFRGSNSAPAWSPDGSQIMFSSSMLGNPELFVVDANGSRPKRVTYSTAASTSPSWNPKTGQSVVFVSDRGGIPKLYMMNADGTNTTELDLPDKGYLIDPAWSPNGQMVAFSWRRPDGNFDIYIMEPATRQIIQITRDSGKNERPSWAPDGRHIVFESTRNGERQIWTMLADGSQAHQLTMSGHNESPNWSPK
ncbi:MAG TPA: Tol-Pal system beta propeller repeat protein TolB [Candidatus Acidoferrum sp.]|nr:Tol-Pal system beta propeller repeat protein TolB [Candidatus Acidoferrum sp.]